MFCASFNLSCTIIRPSQLYGNDESFRKHRPFLYTAIDQAERNENIGIYGVKDALRNYIHIDDFTEILSRIVKNRITGLYSCTNEVDVSLSEVANAVVEAFRSKSRVVYLAEHEDVEDNIFPFDDLLFNKIHFYPKISISEGVKKIAAYRSKNFSVANRVSYDQ
jgi:UDP-glucose 4-epimerase